MTNDISSLIDSAARTTAPVVRGTTDEQLTAPTPCSEYDVRALLNHLFHVVIEFQKLAARQEADFSTTPDRLEGEWRTRFEEETDRLAAAWSDPDALEGVSQGMGLPQRTVAHMVLGDLVVHGWDLARATGQDYTPAEAALAEVIPAFEQMAPMARKAGVFGEEVPAPPGATPFETLLAGTGRDPGWTPATRG
ncbi:MULTISPECIES: TIGR03086 family metal-binding protein [unclassified Streptomyces]|uniref:TIGR03086 family metal-binding protein n=1 Tax=unclassified Streptomyces TaxID=2593676 RepID=UPI002DD8FB36|nr:MULTISPECIES: TIGR03086 family metal-binding protein [unclassified Streptomyces]WSA90287.1 TIGR03086 family metal-binding protein [Streptomyces sp. NBC_01795]WSB74511.1 TIGR03086 family metal-binding protein [Streptomyces sp. NBC_01775]WSS17103.1 TIGR03086 family metal-binding protein [Streptomyces sp. NBC_01186]WSS45847.1 TIGR03086 family metal-binding protein [Streptomyces sp. NBC_01187]